METADFVFQVRKAMDEARTGPDLKLPFSAIAVSTGVGDLLRRFGSDRSVFFFEGIRLHVDDRLENDEWLLCPEGESPWITVYKWVNWGKFMKSPSMHGLREAAMEVEP